MKNTKTRIISLLLSAIMLCSFAACGKQGTEASETTAKPEDTTAESSVQSENLKATDEDFEDLVITIRGVWLSSPVKYTDDLNRDHLVYEKEYLFDSAADSALPDAMYMIQNEGICIYSSPKGVEDGSDRENYNIYNYQDGKESEFPIDPLNQFSGGSYCKLDADRVDWILENVLCVTPDRTKTDDDFDTSKYHGIFNYYYYDGYYYYAIEEGGGGGNFPEIIDYSEQTDGSYIVRFSTEDKDSEYKDDYEILEASVALKDVDGERVWAVSYLKVLEHIDVEN
ncbi:MAG: hypothetical protein SPI97_01755 [Oscillospiraceae bacterium]|nr:hypothetical protein [Oscillospiraceae bacterium]